VFDGGWAHGTHVAGILAATTDNEIGIASSVFNGKILSVKSARENGEDINEPSIHDGYDGITYAAKAGYYSGLHTIINNSWGGSHSSGSEQAELITLIIPTELYSFSRWKW
jgi:subtilisin family serine protease